MRCNAAATSILMLSLAASNFADDAPWNSTSGSSRSSQDKQVGPNELTNREKSEGFKLLFDGVSLDQFTGYRMDHLPKGWSAVDGSVQFTPGKEGGNIRTKEVFGDFDLRLEWKVQPGGNSGIFWRVDETMGAPFVTGLEMQVLDNEKHSDGKNPLTSAGSSYGLYAPTKNVCRPAGQWNAVRIVAIGKRATYWMNGEKIVELEIGSDDFKERMKTVWFKPGADYGSRKSGYIVLQDHGDIVAFRSIRIKKL